MWRHMGRGDCVCVVGEWQGDTGDESFSAALLADWRLIRRVGLPNWTDTAHELAIWQRAHATSALPGDDSLGHSSADSKLKIFVKNETALGLCQAFKDPLPPNAHDIVNGAHGGW